MVFIYLNHMKLQSINYLSMYKCIIFLQLNYKPSSLQIQATSQRIMPFIFLNCITFQQ